MRSASAYHGNADTNDTELLTADCRQSLRSVRTLLHGFVGSAQNTVLLFLPVVRASYFVA